MTRKSTLSVESAAVINHLKSNGSCTAAALLPHFRDMTRPVLLKRLGNLVALGWLDFTWNDAGDKSWYVRSSARTIAVRTNTAAPPPPGLQMHIAGPRCINVMVGTYTPPPGPSLRAGSMDFRTCPSVGYRC
jgi:hypothetical protein